MFLSTQVYENHHALDPEQIDLQYLIQTLRQHGFVILRNWPFQAESFEALTKELCGHFHYVGARRNLSEFSGDGFTTSVFKQNFALLGHTEGSFRPLPLEFENPPEVCFFMCDIPPTALGGETTLVDGCAMLEALPLGLRTRLDEEGITYHMVWEPTRWKNEFNVADEIGLQAFLSDRTNVHYHLDWGVLNLQYTTQAVTRTADGKRDAFATGLLAHLPRLHHPHYRDAIVHTARSNKVCFGNGEELSDDVVNTLVDIHDQLLLKHRWQSKDVLVIDNTRFLHGRTMTEHECERVLFSRFGWLHPEFKSQSRVTKHPQ